MDILFLLFTCDTLWSGISRLIPTVPFKYKDKTLKRYLCYTSFVLGATVLNIGSWFYFYSLSRVMILITFPPIQNYLSSIEEISNITSIYEKLVYKIRGHLITLIIIYLLREYTTIMHLRDLAYEDIIFQETTIANLQSFLISLFWSSIPSMAQNLDVSQRTILNIVLYVKRLWLNGTIFPSVGPLPTDRLFSILRGGQWSELGNPELLQQLALSEFIIKRFSGLVSQALAMLRRISFIYTLATFFPYYGFWLAIVVELFITKYFYLALLKVLILSGMIFYYNLLSFIDVFLLIACAELLDILATDLVRLTLHRLYEVTYLTIVMYRRRTRAVGMVNEVWCMIPALLFSQGDYLLAIAILLLPKSYFLQRWLVLQLCGLFSGYNYCHIYSLVIIMWVQACWQGPPPTQIHEEYYVITL